MPTSRALSAKRKSSPKSIRRNKPTSSLPRRTVFIFLGSSAILLFAALGFHFFDSKPFCANAVSCINDLSGRFDPQEARAEFQGKIVAVPSQETLAYISPEKDVLGETSGPKRIEVNLTNQHLYAYEGDQVVMDFPVSTGKWFPTPTGEFNIWVKLRYTKMEGGSKAINTYYYLPNVPYTMFFYGDNASKGAGYGIHGAYWHNNFGHPMSHGCINMAIEDAGKVFAWADPQTSGWSAPATADNPGTKIVIYGDTPKE